MSAPPDYSQKDRLEDFERSSFELDGETKTVFRKGEGPGVIVMTEIPGITPEVAHLARDIAAEGFTVAMPDLIGTPGKPFSVGYMMRSMSRACISREFHVLAGNRRSPVTDWLRALGRQLHDEVGGPGIGAIGMCLTGNFALSLMLDPIMLAPILSQPSLPFPVSAGRRRALHISPEELDIVRERCERDQVPILALRFTGDRLVPGERFDTLRQCFGERLETVEIDSGPGNPHGLKQTAHSVCTGDVSWEPGHVTARARDRVLAFLRERLLG